jgi:hypothetical protein
VTIVRIVLRRWLPTAVIITALCGLVYGSVQQVLREDANDPQIQMAEDAATALSQDAARESVLPAAHIDLAQSLAPFVIVFDEAGAPLASSAQLHGQVPTIPPGVFEYVRQHGEDRITWQPERGVRMAIVVVGYTGTQQGFVLTGRSLREVEKREGQALVEAGIAWIITLAGSLIMVVMSELLYGDRVSN